MTRSDSVDVFEGSAENIISISSYIETVGFVFQSTTVKEHIKTW